MEDEFLEKAVETLRGNEHKILAEFSKSFMAHCGLQGIPYEDIFTKYQLCICYVTEGMNIVTKYYFEAKDE